MPHVDEMENILIKYAAGEANEADKSAVQRWLAEDPQNSGLLAGMELLFSEAVHLPLPAPPDEHAAWQKVQQRLAARPAKLVGVRWLSAAAAVILLACATALLVSRKPKQVMALPENTVTIIAEYGLKTYTLPDGSVITLTGPSSITYPAGFAGDTRRVKLTGQAFFRVLHQAQKPFVIKVKDITVTDIGTSFYVGSIYANTSVIVYTGAVKISRGDKAVELSQGESITVHPGDSLLTIQAAPKNVVQAAQGFPQAADFKDLPENVGMQKKMMRAILRDIRQDAMADTISAVALDANGLVVNNTKQPTKVFERYKAKYLHLQGLGFYYGHTTTYGTGFVFSAEELNK